MAHPFDPDWTLAPAATLRDWLEENGVSPRLLAVICAGRVRKDEALALIDDVLERRPLTPAHAAMLARGTKVSARFWLNHERLYRADLAAGRKDVTDDDR